VTELPAGAWLILDECWSEWAAALVREPAVERWLTVLAHSGDSQWWLLGGGALWWRAQGMRREFGRRIVLATAAAGLASGLLKMLIRRPRPAGNVRLLHLEFDRHSFPSGHATRAGALAATLGPLMPRRARALMTLWGAAVGASRVLLGVHFASDIAGGLAVGALIGRLLASKGLLSRDRPEPDGAASAS
jgi:membrane-associated phospholipid phosphatase